MADYDRRFLAGIKCFNRQAYFESHEIWEALWRDSHDEAQPFYKGLIQAAVSLYHLERGNLAGAKKLLARSHIHLGPLRPRYLGLDVDRFLREMDQCVEQVIGSLGMVGSSDAPPTLFPKISLGTSREKRDRGEGNA